MQSGWLDVEDRWASWGEIKETEEGRRARRMPQAACLSGEGGWVRAGRDGTRVAVVDGAVG